MDGEAENLFTAEEEAETASILEAVVRRGLCAFNQNRRRGQTRVEDVEVNDDSKCAFRLGESIQAADCWHNFREMEVFLLLAGQQRLKISWNRKTLCNFISWGRYEIILLGEEGKTYSDRVIWLFLIMGLWWKEGSEVSFFIWFLFSTAGQKI